MPTQQLSGNEQYKVLKIEFDPGEGMPDHRAATDAFVIVQKGRAKVIFKEKVVELTEGSYFSIPANKQHSLEVIEAFSAYIVFGCAGKVEFDQSRNRSSL